jgi:hypothetical protein
MHTRQHIRNCVKELLIDQTLTGARVFTHRIHALFEQELPCIIITTPRETATEFNQAPRELKRELTLTIQGLVQATAGVENQLDLLAQEIESAMQQDPQLNSCVADSLLSETEMTVLTEGRLPLGSITLQYRVIYYTA